MGSTDGIAQKPHIRVLMAAPRGFCAGVERAIRTVEKALEKYGAPVFVRHQIVHNRHVVTRLQCLGAVFVRELDEVPDNATVIFSAHGVPKAVVAEAKRRHLTFLDATCPLVSKVHAEAERHHAHGRHLLLIGHRDHPEVTGTIGQLPPGAVTLIETVEDAEAFVPADAAALAYATQTTLSLDDAHAIVAVLRARFASIAGPRKEDVCYATTNRQRAVKSIAGSAGLFLVIGSPQSSNSVRLTEAAASAGARRAMLVQCAEDIDWAAFAGVTTVAISAGASTPEQLVREVVAAIRARYDVELEESVVTAEDVTFNLPRVLAM
jgi:4-hydroxy-3-methylbut-2-en-1-yl diphosphate reductase